MTESRSSPINSPLISPENRPFWDAANNGNLLLKRCGDCARVHWYPRCMCPFCGSTNTHWTPSCGIGRLYSYAVVHTPVVQIPAYVQLKEGVVLLTQLVDVDYAKLGIDVEVEVLFLRAQNGQAVPAFRLA